ncbi:MAG: sulfatase-like hydrolase/transferase [Chloroflexota bacterium]
MTESTRRDFLKLTAAFAGGTALSGLQPALAHLTQSGKPANIIVLLFDAMSARNLSVYGYPRPTTPNLEKFAQRATVYHNHISGGNFTSPGTATFLTGLYPWHHRAINNDSPVRRDLAANNLFHRFGADYVRAAYGQNLWANIFLGQFHDDLDVHLPPNAFVPDANVPFPSLIFPNDSEIAYHALDTFPFTSRQEENAHPGSLLWGYLDLLRGRLTSNRKAAQAADEYPAGMPNNGYYLYAHPELFRNFESTLNDLAGRDKPLFGYFHFFSPHFPYAPRKEFIGLFPPMELDNTARHPLAVMNAPDQGVMIMRDMYDSFIMDLDAELGLTFDFLEQNGLFEDSYVILTSDHGELFERGEFGHGSQFLFNPVIHIPLLISAPGQTGRVDIHTPTSSVDVLPTLLNLAGKPYDGFDGGLLPGFGGMDDSTRSVYSMVAKNASSNDPFQTGTVCLIKGNLKLTYYFGHEKYPDQFEMYDLANDPFERENIYNANPPEAKPMKEELLDALAEANKPYE